MSAYQLIRRLPSRQNRVWLVRDLLQDQLNVEKYFCCQAAYERELRLLLAMNQQNLAVPRLLATGRLLIRMQYIHAPTACDWLAQAEQRKQQVDDALLAAICRLLKQIHELPLFAGQQWRLHDVNLRNILINSEANSVYWLDFEQAGPGRPLDDAADLIAFLLTYQPAMTEYKRELARRLCDQLQHSFCFPAGDLDQAILAALCRIDVRRRTSWLDAFSGFSH